MQTTNQVEAIERTERTKRVLFVDPEPEVLEKLQRMVSPGAGLWETAVAADAESALALLGTSPFDAIVSGVRLPKMDGAALLKTVCERFPTIVRIVLSSQSEMEGALRTVPVAHQFLLKPCDPHMLRVAIERATSLSALLNSKLLATMVGSLRDLPVLPRTYLALRDVLADPDASIKQVVHIVEQDVSISAKILQLVNSAFFGLPREISTLQTAVSFLGVHMLQNLVLSAEVFSVFDKTQLVKGFSFEELHVHSQLVAKIAGRMPAPPYVRSAAIVAGLLHDIGKLVLATRSPKHFARAIAGAREEQKPLYVIEQELMNVSHAEVGAYLLGLWGLPTPVVEAVAHHHLPQRIPHDALDAVAIVHIANVLANEHPVRLPVAGPFPHQLLDADYLDKRGLSDRLPQWTEMAEICTAELRAPAPNVRR